MRRFRNHRDLAGEGFGAANAVNLAFVRRAHGGEQHGIQLFAPGGKIARENQWSLRSSATVEVCRYARDHGHSILILARFMTSAQRATSFATKAPNSGGDLLDRVSRHATAKRSRASGSMTTL